MVLPFSRWCGYQALQAADLLGHVVTTGWLHIIKASPKQLHPPSPSRAAQGHWGRPPDPHHRGRRSSRRPQNPKKESWVKWTNCNCWDQWPPPIKQDTVSFSVLLSTLPWRSLAIQWAERSQHCWKISSPTRVFRIRHLIAVSSISYQQGHHHIGCPTVTTASPHGCKLSNTRPWLAGRCRSARPWRVGRSPSCHCSPPCSPCRHPQFGYV